MPQRFGALQGKPSQLNGGGSLYGRIPNLVEVRVSIARSTGQHNHEGPHRAVGNRTPSRARSAFATNLKSEALTV